MSEVIKVDFKKKKAVDQKKIDSELEEIKNTMNLLLFMILKRTGNKVYASVCQDLFEKILKRCSN